MTYESVIPRLVALLQSTGFTTQASKIMNASVSGLNDGVSLTTVKVYPIQVEAKSTYPAGSAISIKDLFKTVVIPANWYPALAAQAAITKTVFYFVGDLYVHSSVVTPSLNNGVADVRGIPLAETGWGETGGGALRNNYGRDLTLDTFQGKAGDAYDIGLNGYIVVYTNP